MLKVFGILYSVTGTEKNIKVVRVYHRYRHSGHVGRVLTYFYAWLGTYSSFILQRSEKDSNSDLLSI